MKKKLIALAAAAVLAAGLSSAAEAHDMWWPHPYHHWHHGYRGPGFGFGFAFGGFGPVYPHYRPDWDEPPPCGSEWVTGWYRFHHRMVYGPHRVWVC